MALVIGWEQVLFNEDFWRAEKALVVAMAHTKDTHADKPQRRQKRIGVWLEKVAANYRVPILPL